MCLQAAEQEDWDAADLRLDEGPDFDPLCLSCNVVKRQPTLSHFRIPLHCWRYETDEWLFRAPMPRWAWPPPRHARLDWDPFQDRPHDSAKMLASGQRPDTLLARQAQLLAGAERCAPLLREYLLDDWDRTGEQLGVDLSGRRTFLPSIDPPEPDKEEKKEEEKEDEPVQPKKPRRSTRRSAAAAAAVLDQPTENVQAAVTSTQPAEQINVDQPETLPDPEALKEEMEEDEQDPLDSIQGCVPTKEEPVDLL